MVLICCFFVSKHSLDVKDLAKQQNASTFTNPKSKRAPRQLSKSYNNIKHRLLTQFQYNTMIELQSDINYLTPSLTIIEIATEGILCSSNEIVYESDGVW